MNPRIHGKLKVLKTVGSGVAAASILWVLINLVSIWFCGSIIIGEPNSSVLISEISLVTLGLFCFLADLRSRISS
ncbi:MAG: hypothetical protein QG670_579 [Thermoproteota archaeon]|nr:hypothetical protein [Thermoproteota archaeon]